VKYAGAWAALIGFVILLALGWNHAWSLRGEPVIRVELGLAPVVIGIILLIGGLVAYVFIEE
jgi:hypothetical protein